MCIRDRLYFESTNNSNGTAEIVVTFEPGTDPDLAQVDVQNRLKKAEARMPQAVLTQGLQVERVSYTHLDVYKRQGSADPLLLNPHPSAGHV